MMLLICTLLLWEPNDWPSFRGTAASGVADGMHLPDNWNGPSGKNIRWRCTIPGLAHASPIVWGDTLYVTTAVSGKSDVEFKPGLYGSGEAADDANTHQWLLFALHKKTGELQWKKTMLEGVPRSKRHIKATQNNATPVTNGRFLIVHLGSEGLYAFDMKGQQQWKVDLGVMDVGAYDAPTYEWGPASSPIIFQDKVIVQVDTQAEDFVAAFHIQTGKELWRTSRDELPSWGTPGVYQGPEGNELITNSSKHIYGYNPQTGKELWRVGGSSNITAPTPVFAPGVILVASGRRPVKPIFAIKPGGRGTLQFEGEENEHILWRKTGRGPYMPTPVIYKEFVYSLNNNGVFDCYELATGKEVYRERIAHGGAGFSASPVAADGKIYLPGEDGSVFVIQAGKEFKQIAANDLGEVIMASPALSDGMLYVRGRNTLFAIGK